MTDFNYDQTRHLKQLLPQKAIDSIDQWKKKYPPDRHRPPIIAALTIAQDHSGNWLTEEMMQAVAEYLDVPHIAVYEVATFYSMFHLEPMGKYVISVCNNISCAFRGADKVIQHLQDRLNIKVGETTQDGLFSIKTVECMAACGGAPMLEVNKKYHENLTDEKIDQILSELSELELNRPSDKKNSPQAEAKE